MMLNMLPVIRMGGQNFVILGAAEDAPWVWKGAQANDSFNVWCASFAPLSPPRVTPCCFRPRHCVLLVMSRLRGLVGLWGFSGMILTLHPPLTTSLHPSIPPSIRHCSPSLSPHSVQHQHSSDEEGVRDDCVRTSLQKTKCACVPERLLV